MEEAVTSFVVVAVVVVEAMNISSVNVVSDSVVFSGIANQKNTMANPSIKYPILVRFSVRCMKTGDRSMYEDWRPVGAATSFILSRRK